MTITAFISQTTTFWWVALGVGLVVVLVVAVLLTLLLRILADVEVRLERAGQVAETLATTDASGLLGRATDTVDALSAEIDLQRKLLERR